MDNNSAMHILKESYRAKEILFDLVPKYIPIVKNYKDNNDINSKLYRGVFESYHTIMSNIENEIYKEFPEIHKEFHSYLEEKYAKSKYKSD